MPVSDVMNGDSNIEMTQDALPVPQYTSRRNTYVKMSAAQNQEDATIKVLDTNQNLKSSKTSSSAA